MSRLCRLDFPPTCSTDRPEEASRLLSLSYLNQIDSAHARLGDQLDQEALHDFRVGIRRLRSAIRAYRTELEGSVSGKMRRRLRDLARATNDGRDVEVQLAWLGKQSQLLGPDDIPGFYWLVGRLEDRKQKTHDRAVADVARRYEKVAGTLRRALGILRIELQIAQGQRPATFREVTGALAQRQLQRLRDDLGRIQGPGDVRAGAPNPHLDQAAQVSAGADRPGQPASRRPDPEIQGGAGPPG